MQTDSLGDGIETVVSPDLVPPRIQYEIDGVVAVTVRAASPPTALVHHRFHGTRSGLLRHAVALIFAADRMNQIEFEQHNGTKLTDGTSPVPALEA